MLEVKTITQEKYFWKAGAGTCYFWYDEWMERGPLIFATLNDPSDKTAKLSDYCDNGFWACIKLSGQLPQRRAVDIFLNVHINLLQPARPLWKPTSNGEFSTKSAWNLIRRRAGIHNVKSLCWHTRFPSTVSIFSWKVLHGWFSMDEVMQTKGVIIVFKCQCCNQLESIRHVLL